MNVTSGLQVSRWSPPAPSADSVGIPVTLAPTGEPGAFSFLLNGLVNHSEESFLAGLIQEQPLDLAGFNAVAVSLRAKSKDIKSGVKSSSSANKDEPEPKLGLIEATQDPTLAIIKPPILFRPVTWETYSQGPETSRTGPPVDAAGDGPVEATGISTTSSTRADLAIPTENEPDSTGRIVFGLRLTTPNPDTGMSARSSAPEPPAGRVISSVRAMADARSGASSDSSPVLNGLNDAEDLSLLAHQKAPPPMNRPDPPGSSGSSHVPASQVTSFQAISSQALPSLATASQANQAADQPEIITAPQPPPAKQISLKLTGEDSASVNVEVSERAGKVQVAVRTADPDLAKSLRRDLSDLVGRLEDKGFKAEAWVPRASRHAPADAREQSGSPKNQSDPRYSGSGMGQRRERQGQNGSNQRQQAHWSAQLEETLSTEETRT